MALKDWFGSKKDGPPWPKDEIGTPVRPVFLTHLTAVDMEGPIVIGLLESAGIPVVTQHPNNGDFGRIIIGFSGTGLDIYVPATLLEDARAMLEGQFELEFEEENDNVSS